MDVPQLAVQRADSVQRETERLIRWEQKKKKKNGVVICGSELTVVHSSRAPQRTRLRKLQRACREKKKKIRKSNTIAVNSGVKWDTSVLWSSREKSRRPLLRATLLPQERRKEKFNAGKQEIIIL